MVHLFKIDILLLENCLLKAIYKALICNSTTSITETEKEIFKAILDTDLDLQSSPWPSISPSAKDLVKKMLTKDPKKRITAAEALGKYMLINPQNHFNIA